MNKWPTSAFTAQPKNNKCRLIVTLQCNRNCHYCYNKHDSIKQVWRDVMLDEVVGKYDTYVITGGEPLMIKQLDRTLHVLEQLQSGGESKIYMYTSICSLHLPDIMPLIDGITYSVHYNMDAHDLSMFKRFQTYAEFYDEHSFYLNIDSGVDTPLPIIPSVWTRIQSFKPLTSCPVPEGEDLFRLVEVF